jgi:hypothetical protein
VRALDVREAPGVVVLNGGTLDFPDGRMGWAIAAAVIPAVCGRSRHSGAS